MTPHVLIVHPDLGLAGRLKELILSGDEAAVGFADTFADGCAELEKFPYLDLCVCGLRYWDEGARLFSLIKERFPRARFLMVNGDPSEPVESFDPGVMALTMPEEESRFVCICQETFASLHGMLLSHFRLGARFRSDRWSDWYEAYDTMLKREVYVTVLHAWATPEEAEHFVSTASLMARAAHENVLAVFLGGEHEGRSFISHEKWTMPSLARLVEKGERIDARMAVRILHAVAEVLRFWDYNEVPHLPLDASHVTISPSGVVKVRNCVNPTLPFKPLQLDDMAEVASAVLALLPPLSEIPQKVRDLINKIRAHPKVTFETSIGGVVVELFNDRAPMTVANFLSYVDRGAYDETLFHHVVSGFVVQGGRLRENLTKVPVESTFPHEGGNGLRNLRGTLAMARNPTTQACDCQFIFNLVDNALIKGGVNDHGCTVFGKVTMGMEVIDKMAETPVTMYDKYRYFPADPIVLFRVRRSVSVTVADIEAEAQAQALDAQMAAEMPVPTPTAGQKWAKAMTSTDKALASVSKVIHNISASLLRK